MDELDEEDYSRAFCDAKGCGDAKVRARLVVALPSGRVLCFCFHHANRYRTRLEEEGAIIVELSPA